MLCLALLAWYAYRSTLPAWWWCPALTHINFWCSDEGRDRDASKKPKSSKYLRHLDKLEALSCKICHDVKNCFPISSSFFFLLFNIATLLREFRTYACGRVSAPIRSSVAHFWQLQNSTQRKFNFIRLVSSRTHQTHILDMASSLCLLQSINFLLLLGLMCHRRHSKCSISTRLHMAGARAFRLCKIEWKLFKILNPSKLYTWL